MNANCKKLTIFATTAIIVAIMSMPSAVSAGSAKPVYLSSPPPPPSWGYYGSPPIVLDYALALSLQTHSIDEYPPYYTRFMYNYCDFRNCTLQRKEVVNKDGSRTSSWVPVWYGPFN
jgi:hypothetical protein